jgi:hypothetical protein
MTHSPYPVLRGRPTAQASLTPAVVSTQRTFATVPASWQRALHSDGSSTAEVAIRHALAIALSTGVLAPSAVAATHLTPRSATFRRGPRPLRRGR